MQDIDYIRIIMWVLGILFTLANSWTLLLIRNMKQDHKDLTKMVIGNERIHVTEHSQIYDKINSTINRMDREFVHKDHLADLKKEVKEGFDEIKELIREQRRTDN